MQRTFNLSRELLCSEDILESGVLSCQGCGSSLALKLAMKGLGRRTVIVLPAQCTSIIVGIYPDQGLKIPIVHIPIETAAVTAAGIRTALDVRGEDDIVVMAWAGDGGTFDIGLQSLSGTAERNDDILFVCNDNEAYMNTGVQRSSATPYGAWTTTTPKGALKTESKKDIRKIMLGHHIPYFATASVAYPDDLVQKFRKARTIKGMRFIHLLSPCPTGWRISASESIRVGRMATQAKVFPLYEVEQGVHTLNVVPNREIPVSDYLRAQGRFDFMTDAMIEDYQQRTDGTWKDLQKEFER